MFNHYSISSPSEKIVNSSDIVTEEQKNQLKKLGRHLQKIEDEKMQYQTSLLGTLPAGDEDEGSGSPGLSTLHISRKGVIRSYNEGSLLEVQKPKVENLRSGAKPTKRGAVKGFTNSSRRRLMRTVAKTDKSKFGCFVTLTYPEEFPENDRVYKRHLDNFLKRLVYHFPEASGVWKLEPQDRGAPHYHLMVWGVNSMELILFVPRAWYEVVGSGDEKHLLWHKGLLGNGNRPCVEEVRSWRGVMSYCGKYLGKVVLHMPGWEEVGRYWGIFHRSAVPWSKVEIRECNYREAVQFMRFMCRYAHLKKRDYKSLTIYVNNPEVWVQKLC